MHPALQRFVDFCQTRPIAWGAPVAGALGLVLGGVFYIGPQQADPTAPMLNPYGLQTEEAAPIAWPSGKVPDYVIGTDFLAMTRAPQPIYVAMYDASEPPPPPEPPMASVEPQPARVPSPPRETHVYASTSGDILDIRLPEDRAAPAQQEAPLVLAEAAPAR